MTKNRFDLLSNSCLPYFGKMTASATHELKNALAIINENAGLLDDLVELSKRNSSPLSQERIQRIASALKTQVLRADDTLKKLNRFSHSVDKDVQMVDIMETALFVVTISSRLLDMKNLSITFTEPEDPIVVETHLFLLQTLLWKAIETCSTLSDGQKTLNIELTSSPAPSIWFPVTESNLTAENILSSKPDLLLMKQLQISLQFDPEKYVFGLVWPNQH